MDFLFEIWVCKMLLKAGVQNLCYEPSEVIRPPDFRGTLTGVQFDIQVKRLHNVSNEIAKKVFQRECRRRLRKHSQPWFINLKISDAFQRQHINGFFSYLDKMLPSFSARSAQQGMLQADDYVWEFEGTKLISFSFNEKNKKAAGISIGSIHSGNPGTHMLQMVDVEPYRKAMGRVLKKAKTTFSESPSDKQSNLVIVQPESELWDIDSDQMADTLYGDDQTVVGTGSDGNEIQKDIRGPNGILKKYKDITGVIFVPSKVSFLEEKFTGSYFLSEFHLSEICIHPKLFNEMTYYVLPEWKTK